MPEPTEEAQEAPQAPAETDVTPTPEVTAPAETEGQAELTEEQLNDLSPDEALAYLQGKSIEIPDKPKVEEAAPETEEPEVTEVETTPAAEVPAEPVTPEKILPNRITTDQFDTDEQKAIDLMHVLNKGKRVGDEGRVTLKEAMAQLDGIKGKGKDVTPPAPSPVDVISEKLTEQETQLKTLREQKKQALSDGEPIDEIEDQIENTRDAISSERTRLAIAQDRAERQQAQEAAESAKTVNAAHAEQKAQIVKSFPSITNPESPLGLAVAATIAKLKSEDHPDLHEEDAPTLVRDRALNLLAKKEGISFEEVVEKYKAKQAPEAAKPTPPAPKPATPAPKKVLPARGSQVTQPPKGLPTVQEVYDAVKDDGDGESAWEAIYGNTPLNLLRP